MYECRYDERLKTNVEESTCLGYTVGIRKDNEEVNGRDVCKCDG